MRSPRRGSGRWFQRNPRLAKPRLGLNSGRCFAAPDDCFDATHTSVARSHMSSEAAFHVSKVSFHRLRQVTVNIPIKTKNSEPVIKTVHVVHQFNSVPRSAVNQSWSTTANWTANGNAYSDFDSFLIQSFRTPGFLALTVAGLGGILRTCRIARFWYAW